MSDVCVVHLVWAPLGIEPFGRFVASYKQTKDDVDHHLLLVFNGFREKRELNKYYDLLDGLAYTSLFMTHSTLDIPAYFAAARSVDHKYLCFLNSHSVILDDSWLAKMYKHITREEVGLVGATGSHMSLYSCTANTRFEECGVLLKDVWRLFHKRLIINNRYRLYFPRFPNPHIRTNAFMLARDVMLKLKVGAIKSKMAAHRFESGSNSLTRQVLGMNLKALVVGRDGKAYEKDQWFESGALWVDHQDNLLVADNRTREYLQLDPYIQRIWTRTAWGNK